MASLNTSAGANSLGVLLAKPILDRIDTGQDSSVKTNDDWVKLQEKYPDRYQTGPADGTKENVVKGRYDEVENATHYTPNSDISTFSHEHAHWYMIKLFQYAGEEGMNAEVIEDAEKLLNVFGINSLDDCWITDTFRSLMTGGK